MNSKYTLWLEFEMWDDQPQPIDLETNFFNMKINFEDGRTYALNVWTLTYLEKVIHAQVLKNRNELIRFGVIDGEHPIDYEYLFTPDLVVTRMDRELIEEVIDRLLSKLGGLLPPEWES